MTRWLAARAADAPENFLHLLRLLEAERAWAVGDFRAAALAFDAARREVAGRQRPWHRALITERAARFYLAHGVEHAGYDLLAQARQEYLAWGATAKVDQLDWAYPTLRPRPDATAEHGGDQPGDRRDGRATVTTGTLDLLGILSASQALSSRDQHRTAARPRGRGARRDDRRHRRTPAAVERRPARLAAARTARGGTAPSAAPATNTQLPMSVLRYAQRTR